MDGGEREVLLGWELGEERIRGLFASRFYTSFPIILSLSGLNHLLCLICTPFKYVLLLKFLKVLALHYDVICCNVRTGVLR